MKVSVYKNYILKIELENKIFYFDVEPYLSIGDFKILKDNGIFKNFNIDELGAINWLNGDLSLSKDTLLKNITKI